MAEVPSLPSPLPSRPWQRYTRLAIQADEDERPLDHDDEVALRILDGVRALFTLS